MKKTIVATAVAALLATTALPAVANDGLSLGVDLGSAVSLDSDGLDLGLGTDAGVSLDAGNSSLDANANLGAGVAVDNSHVHAGANSGVSLDADDDVNLASSTNAGAHIGHDDDQLAVGAVVDASAGINLNDIDSSRVSIVLASSVNADVLDQSLAIDSDARLAAALDDNVAIKTKLDAAGYAASDVLALKGNADGTVLVFIDDIA